MSSLFPTDVHLGFVHKAMYIVVQSDPTQKVQDRRWLKIKLAKTKRLKIFWFNNLSFFSCLFEFPRGGVKLFIFITHMLFLLMNIIAWSNCFKKRFLHQSLCLVFQLLLQAFLVLLLYLLFRLKLLLLVRMVILSRTLI